MSSSPDTGYSSTPLTTKLGIKPGSRVLVVGAAPEFDLGPLPAGVAVHTRTGSSPYQVGVLFAPTFAALVRRWPSLHAAVTAAGRLWVAWPKKASGVVTDLDESLVREYGLSHGRVDMKVCAIDATWSGLGFVVRLVDR